MLNKGKFFGVAIQRNKEAARATMLLLASIFMMFMISGCTFDVGMGQMASSVDRAVTVIDNGIAAINQNSASWQSVLQRVANELPEDISQTVRVDAQNLATRSISTAGVEFRCNTDFLANRAVQALQRLKAELRNQKPPPLAPAFCQVSPDNIDLKADPARQSTVSIYGYDLDQRDSEGKLFQVMLLTSQGTRIPLPESRIGRTTHYQVTLNLGGYFKELYDKKVTKIIVSWGGSTSGFPEVIIVQWEPKRERYTQSIGVTGPFYPPHTGGDKDFNTGSGPTDLTLKAEMQKTDTVVRVRTYMFAREQKPDNTKVEGWSSWSTAYTAPAGYRIISVNPNTNSTCSGVVTQQGLLKFDRPAGEIVEYFEVWVDQSGDEAGSFTKVTTHWRALEITIETIKPSWL